jgi:cytochrome P450
MKGLMVAGYESTSASMTWALIELCKHQEIQIGLRDELLKAFPSSDPLYDDLVSPTTLPLLDAVVHETLRLHPAINETWREAIHDDVLPLSEPIRLPNGMNTDRISVGKGQAIMVPVAAVNRSCVFWGEDAKDFRPQRWIDGVNGKAQEILAYRHILTFIDGPKTYVPLHVPADINRI